ncbi:unnamed protein product [Darwinula stevensoni]|uniref:Putative 2'-deoxynucleoside 5'-phosphate N-hydrolase 1 n=1 Tax=Darwinula stevensoni TaxID=69355 RepID=A0A7R9AAW8_9CRUS|nr:unnamed protein product [Darwinula stevensoni]CAG0898629.1 unnamed protein product [Darwinula stevensoni]
MKMAPQYNIYLCGSIRGGRQDVQIYGKIAEKLKEYGTVLTPFVADPNVRDEEDLDDRAIFERDNGLMAQADVLVAEVTVPSLGVGMELGWALRDKRIPILCLYRPQNELSALVRGLADGNTNQVKDYKEEELDQIIEDFFNILAVKNVAESGDK